MCGFCIRFDMAFAVVVNLFASCVPILFANFYSHILPLLRTNAHIFLSKYECNMLCVFVCLCVRVQVACDVTSEK